MRRRFFVLLEGRKPEILEKLVKALFEWLASLWYEMVEYLLDQLMELFNVDLSYFAERVPVIDDIANIFVAVGWALLIGNLAYQAMRSMASGVGIEAEEPGRLFLRSAMFSFLLLVSRQICAIGFGLSATVMEMLQAPDAVTFDPFGEETFDTLPNAGWLIVIVVNIVIQWQLIRLFFEVAERYVILCVLTYCAPLAFAMGGSKSTGDIFRGWLRMFASMCVLMVFNLMFVKLVLSALSTDPNGAAIIPWAMLVVGIVRMAKKMDGIILRIGLNPALTGDPLGARFPGALTAMTLRSIASVVTHTAAKHTPSAGYSNTFGSPPREGPLWGGMGKNGTGGPVSSGRLSDSRKESIRSRTAAEGTAVTRGAGSGMRAAQELEAFRRRYGADNTEKMRQVRGTVSINANDFDDESHISSHVEKNSSAAETISEAGGRVTPPAPPKRPLSENFGRMDPPRTDGKLPPVMPQRTADGQASHMVSPVTPQPPEQAFHALSGRETAQGHGDSAPEYGGRKTEPAQQAGKISPVMPPLPQQAKQGTDAHAAQPASRSTAARVMPANPPAPSGRMPPAGKGAVPSQVVAPADNVPRENRVHGAASVTAASARATSVPPPITAAGTVQEQSAVHPAAREMPISPPIAAGGAPQEQQTAAPVASAAAAAGSIASRHADKARISPAREAPLREARPATGNVVSPARRQEAPAAQQGAPSPARVTPSAPHKTSAQAAAQVTPAQVAAVTPAAPPQAYAQPAAKLQPDVAPADRCPTVTPAIRERKPDRPDTASHPDVTPGVRTPDMVTPPPAVQPRTLRRSAQPLKNKAAPETPKGGGPHNRKRRRKK